MKKTNMRWVALSLVLGALIVGCSDSSGPGADPAVGVFTLQTINGSNLPFNLGTQSGVTVEVLNDAYSINADGTYSEQGTLRLTQAGTITTQQETETGLWTRNGTALTFNISTSTLGDTGSYSGALSGSTITITGNGIVGVYKK